MGEWPQDQNGPEPDGVVDVLMDDAVDPPSAGSDFNGVHNDLDGRSTANAHPISAITGLEDALDDLAAADATTSPHEFIYNSGGAQSGNRFNNWDDLMTAVAAVPEGVTRVIGFEQDESLTLTGNLDFVEFRGNYVDWFFPGGVTVTILIGSSITSWLHCRVTMGLLLLNQADAPITMGDNEQFGIGLENGGTIACDGAPFVRQTGSGSLLVCVAFDEGRLFNGTSAYLTDLSNVPAAAGNYEVFEDNGTGLNFNVLTLRPDQVHTPVSHLIRGTNASSLFIRINASSSSLPGWAEMANPNYAGFAVPVDSLNASVLRNLRFDDTTAMLGATNGQTAIEALKALIDGISGTTLSDADPADLGTAAPGTSQDASRADHVHTASLPELSDVDDALDPGVGDIISFDGSQFIGVTPDTWLGGFGGAFGESIIATARSQVEQLWTGDGVVDDPTTLGIADTDTAGGPITLDATGISQAKRSVTIVNLGGTDDVILDGVTISGVANPHVPPHESRTIYVPSIGGLVFT